MLVEASQFIGEAEGLKASPERRCAGVLIRTQKRGGLYGEREGPASFPVPLHMEQ